jgi:ABC-2 type transport system permease protein
MNIKDIKNTILGFFSRLSAWALGSGRMSGPERTRNIQLALIIVIILLINLAGMTLNFRCDLTRNNTYSLSGRSKEIVSSLKENLKIKVLFSKDLPAQHTSIYRYLIDLLEEYHYYANEYFSYEIVGEKELEKQAADYGIRPVQSQEYDNDQVKVRRTYMALVIQQSDVVEKIEAITDPTGLEYNITSLMRKMSGKIDGLLRLTQPIQLLFFMDTALKSLPIDGIETLPDKIKEAVSRCNTTNYDKLRLQVLDPSVDKNTSISAELYGVPKLKWKAGQDPSGKAVPAGEAYLGIVLKNRDKVDLIEIQVAPTIMGKNVITGLDKLQDRINNAVGSLVSANPRIGYITGHGEVDLNDKQSPQGGVVLKQVLSDVYEVKEVNLTKEDIPADLGLIIINGPRKEFTQEELFRIDQFLMMGKGAIFFLDSFNEISFGQQNMFGRQPAVLPIITGLDPLLGSYGITVGRNIVLDESCAKAPVGGAIKEIYYVPIIRKAGFNQDIAITKFLRGMAFIKASTVNADAGKVKERKLSRIDLVTTSDESWQMTGQINYNPFLLTPPENKSEMKKQVLALLLSGKFESYFKGKEAPRAAEGDKGAAAKKETFTVGMKDGTVQSGTTRVIVVGSSEITRSGFLMNSKRILSSAMGGGEEQDRVFSNGFFIHSMADYLLGNAFIPEMSSKSLDYNPLDKTGDTTKIILKSLNIAGVPLFVILAGLAIWKRRSLRRKKLQEEFSAEARHE